MWLQDLRVTVRSLARTLGFTLAAVTALTLGLGASTGIFSVVDAVLLKPLPYPGPERIVVFASSPGAAVGRGGPQVPPTVFNLLRQHGSGIRDIAAYRFRSGNLTGGDTPELLGIATVSADFFRLFGGFASHGRTFLADEDRPGGPEVAVLGHDFWRRRFGGEPNVVGTVVSLDGVSRLVVGVLDGGLDVSIFGLVPDVWTPLRVDPDSNSHAGGHPRYRGAPRRDYDDRQRKRRSADGNSRVPQTVPRRARFASFARSDRGRIPFTLEPLVESYEFQAKAPRRSRCCRRRNVRAVMGR